MVQTEHGLPFLHQLWRALGFFALALLEGKEVKASVFIATNYSFFFHPNLTLVWKLHFAETIISPRDITVYFKLQMKSFKLPLADEKEEIVQKSKFHHS